MSGGRYYKPCRCQPQLDLINKFHHLDRDHAFGKTNQAEEVHHCGTIDGFDKSYKVKHCSCVFKSDCPNCSRNSVCPARIVHAIDTKEAFVYLHLAFVDILPEMHAPIVLTLLERCPENEGYYHLNVDQCKVSWQFLTDLRNYKDEAIRLRPVAAWAERVQKKVANIFEL